MKGPVRVCARSVRRSIAQETVCLLAETVQERVAVPTGPLDERVPPVGRRRVSSAGPVAATWALRGSKTSGRSGC